MNQNPGTLSFVDMHGHLRRVTPHLVTNRYYIGGRGYDYTSMVRLDDAETGEPVDMLTLKEFERAYGPVAK